MKIFKKILDLLTPKEQKRFFLLLTLILIMAIFDMFGVASIFPFITLVANPQIVESNIFFSYFYQKSSILGVTNIKEFIFMFGILIFLILITSLVVRAITYYVQTRYTLMLEYSIGRRLIENYLRQPYNWFLSRNSADLGKNILSESAIIGGSVITPVIIIISQTAVILLLLILLVATDPVLAFSIGLVLASSFLCIFYLMKNILSRIGSERLKANTDRFTLVSEAFGAAKEVKVGGLEQVYINRFDKPSKIYAGNQSLFVIISLLPRYFLEAIAFGGMILLVLFLMVKGDNFIKIVPIIGLYAFAGFRLMPAIQQVYANSAQIRFHLSSLNAAHKDLVNLKYFEQSTSGTSTMRFNKSITLKNIYFSYPNTKKPALENIDLSIPAYSKVGIVGATGSGKTTMVDLILGLFNASKGTLSVDGNLITNNNKRSWQKNIGYVPQQIYLSDTSIAANIAFGVEIKNIDYQLVEKAAKIANFHNFIKKLPDGYNTVVGERGVRLSGGQRQRIGIARALYNNPQILILDEATSALDNLTEQAVMEAVNNLGSKITIILIAHRLSTVKNCDTIFLLEQGKLIGQGTYEELNQSNEQFMKMSGVIL
jgi:ABC-type multidrug transport system fused ATPase/permease subunit